MKNILHIVSSINGQNSYSLALSRRILENLQKKYQESKIVERNIVAENFPHITEETWSAIITPQANRTEEQNNLVKLQDEVIKELFDADILVVGAPLYNFGIPSQLKAYIDHLAKNGETFHYTEEGPEGLVKDKKVYIAMSSGGVYSENPLYDYVSGYLTKVFGFIGMTDVEIVRIEGLAIPELQDEAMDKAQKQLEEVLG
ncbi:FMN-dependent NADH-azoreductase [Zunongwangia sp.]|uniref:FMN-dependent NADH-azoreductase n=1 Tax=Zunongwangia sp. TaxID=1965325 RepID=UPI003AA9CA9B